MTNEDEHPRMSAGTRRAIYTLLIVTSLCSCAGRIMTVRSKDGRGPFLSANDRSRWCTIRALVDSNTYVIDKLQNDNQWQTIDKVQHVGRDEKLHFYSSKPPLLPTLLAGQYWLIKNLAGATFKDHPFPIARVMLMITNWLPLAFYFWLMIGLIERWGETDWGRIFAVAATAWGTYLTTFVVTLNNHLPAAICTLICLHLFIRIWYEGETRRRYYVIAGLAAGFAAVNELPALSLVGLLGLALLWRDWKQTLCFGVPALLLVAGGFFGTNYVAHARWKPPYAHRDKNDDAENWYVYEGSHWLDENRKGIDAGEPSVAIYAVHSLVGHHGVFSLTPIWCMSAVGIGLMLARNRPHPMPTLAVGIAVLTLVCLTFYIFLRPPIDRNYGGVSGGFRWMFWFTPLWIFALLPCADRMAESKALRRVAYVCLGISVLSTAYPSANPWQHPWPYQIAEYLGWVG